MYPSPISVAVPSYGWIGFLSFDVKRSLCTLFKARLHSPVDQITAIGKTLKARDLHSSDGIIFLTSDNDPIKTVQFVEGSISMIVKQKKKDLVKLADKMHVPSTGTIAEITQRLQAHSEKLVLNTLITVSKLMKFTPGIVKNNHPSKQWHALTATYFMPLNVPRKQ